MSIPAVPDTMRALRQTSLHGPHDLHLVTDAPVPAPGPGEILVRVTAAGVNYGDLMMAHGTYPDGPQPPFIGGFEAAGEVVAVGAGVSSPEIGAHVAGVTMGGGAYAEYLTLFAAAALPVPPGWRDDQALGLAVNWPTVLAALKPLGRVAEGETVLIHAAAGATGQAAVTLAKHYGATVLAAASPGKHDVVRALGADHVLDSRSPDWAAEALRLTDGQGVDLILAAAGGAAFEASLAAAKPVTGRVVVYGTIGGDASVSNRDLVFTHQVQVIGLNIGVVIQRAPAVFGQVMAEMAALIGSGVIAPGDPVAHALADGPKVLIDLENRVTSGKQVLLPR
jgi:NADPH2:quinone reductase